jgi:hypothetical protein
MAGSADGDAAGEADGGAATYRTGDIMFRIARPRPSLPANVSIDAVLHPLYGRVDEPGQRLPQVYRLIGVGLGPPWRASRGPAAQSVPQPPGRRRSRVVQQSAGRAAGPGAPDRRVPPGLFGPDPLTTSAAAPPGPRLADRQVPRLGEEARRPPRRRRSRSRRDQGTR